MTHNKILAFGCELQPFPSLSHFLRVALESRRSKHPFLLIAGIIVSVLALFAMNCILQNSYLSPQAVISIPKVFMNIF